MALVEHSNVCVIEPGNRSVGSIQVSLAHLHVEWLLRVHQSIPNLEDFTKV